MKVNSTISELFFCYHKLFQKPLVQSKLSVYKKPVYRPKQKQLLQHFWPAFLFGFLVSVRLVQCCFTSANIFQIFLELGPAQKLLLLTLHCGGFVAPVPFFSATKRNSRKQLERNITWRIEDFKLYSCTEYQQLQ